MLRLLTKPWYRKRSAAGQQRLFFFFPNIIKGKRTSSCTRMTQLSRKWKEQLPEQRKSHHWGTELKLDVGSILGRCFIFFLTAINPTRTHVGWHEKDNYRIKVCTRPARCLADDGEAEWQKQTKTQSAPVRRYLLSLIWLIGPQFLGRRIGF